MARTIFSFHWEVEKKFREMTALAGMPTYLEVAHLVPIRDSTRNTDGASLPLRTASTTSLHRPAVHVVKPHSAVRARMSHSFPIRNSGSHDQTGGVRELSMKQGDSLGYLLVHSGPSKPVSAEHRRLHFCLIDDQRSASLRGMKIPAFSLS